MFAVPFREPPRYNPRRRTAAGAGGGGGAHHLHPNVPTSHSIRTPSDPISLELPPSPSPSNRSLPPFSSASSSMSETSSGSTQPSVEDSASYITGIQPSPPHGGFVLSHSFHCACKGVNVGVCIGVGVDSMPTTRFSMPADKSDIISDSSGVGTSNSDSTTQSSVLLPGTTVVCLENYSSGLPGHLRISQGDILEG